MHSICTVEFDIELGLATKWLRILSLGGIDKIRKHLVANPICSFECSKTFVRNSFSHYEQCDLNLTIGEHN